MKAPELTAFVNVLTERLANVINALGRLESEGKSTAQAVSDLRQEVDRTIPVLEEAVEGLKRWKQEEEREREAYLHLKRDVEELKKWKADQKQEKDELIRRKWAFGPNLVGAVIAVLGNLIILAINILFTWSRR